MSVNALKTQLFLLSNKCEECLGKFKENGMCIDSCSPGYFSNLNNECEPCSKLKLKVKENECVDECDTNKYKYNYINNVCEPLM